MKAKRPSYSRKRSRHVVRKTKRFRGGRPKKTIGKKATKKKRKTQRKNTRRRRQIGGTYKYMLTANEILVDTTKFPLPDPVNPVTLAGHYYNGEPIRLPFGLDPSRPYTQVILPYTLLYVGTQYVEEVVPRGVESRMNAGFPTEPVYILKNFDSRFDAVRGFTAVKDAEGEEYILGKHAHLIPNGTRVYKIESPPPINKADGLTFVRVDIPFEVYVPTQNLRMTEDTRGARGAREAMDSQQQPQQQPHPQGPGISTRVSAERIQEVSGMFPNRNFSEVGRVEIGNSLAGQPETSELALIKYPLGTPDIPDTPMVFEGDWIPESPPIEWVSSDITTVMKRGFTGGRPHGRMVVLASQANGAEHPSERNDSIPTPENWLDTYMDDKTGGPAGQLTGHRGVAKEVVRISEANIDERREGDFYNTNLPINYFREVFDLLEPRNRDMFEVVNGYFRCKTTINEDGMYDLLVKLNKMGQLLSLNNPAVGNGFNRRVDELSDSTPRVDVVYATAIPLTGKYGALTDPSKTHLQRIIGLNIIYHQYRLALTEACFQATAREFGDTMYEVYLMPLGGGVFNNPLDNISLAIQRAIHFVSELPGFNRLKIRVLFYNDKLEYMRYINIVDSEGNRVFSPNASS